ncbi:MAG: hypothetical protein WCF04_15070 [Candidatus Nanopelagicales bacterium]
MREAAIAVFMTVMGLGIAGIWTRDIIAGTQVDRSRGLRHARDSNGSWLAPHWVAEYATSAALLIASFGLFSGATWAPLASAAALGSTWYTSTNSLGWALAQPDRRPYAAPMAIGLIGSTLSLAALLAGP